MSKIYDGFNSVSALSLNNPQGTQNGLQDKYLKIKYLSCKEESGYVTLYFEIQSKGLKDFICSLSVYREGKLGFYPEGISKIEKVSNGISKLSFGYHKYSDNMIGSKNNFYAIISVDNISAKSQNFKTVFKSESSSLQNCGSEYKNKIRCTEYHGTFGPEYVGEISLKQFKLWNNLISNSVVTQDEKDILIAMSENEGNLDCVQSYDSEVFSAGAMQKTVNTDGEGEFPIQLYEFNMSFPEKASKLEKCGWKVEAKDNKYIISYNGISGKELKNYIRDGFTKESFKKFTQCKPLEAIIKLLNDTDFQTKQIEDFIERLHFCLQIKPSNYNYKIGDFLKTKLGRAIALDHHVNRKAHVKKCFGESLDTFFKQNSQVSKNPNDWGNNFSVYEKKILEIYGPLRGEKSKGYSMTNAKIRYDQLKNKL
ncbi:hypothetical protein H9Q08_04045 [Chryseobacterium sp. PS-8]|uniref:ApeA N-terminal domain-containing protein n=1 Tax=Chryseobacterium indicum TaxID=2766954 RepID=A0ABS9C2N6_9FLAO|nr:hypothetical protein [Chryseobacterium sp. PS-8]MCF2218469.1 hypothetical protein [Chryseobacterium sp. PS-8]